MHDGTTQSGDVETLGRRGDGDSARRDLRMQRCERNMLVVRVDDVRVNLVGHYYQVVSDHEVRRPLQFSPAEGAPGGVLRMAKYQHAQSGIGGCFISAQVEHPPSAVIA